MQTEILQPAHPILFGYAGKNIPMRWADGPILSIAGAPPDGGPEAPPSDADNGAIARASVLVRFQGGDTSVLSGVMRGADQIRNRPAIIDAPVGRGRVIYFADNPIYRWQTFGEHQLVFNALLFFNDMPELERRK